MHIFSTHNIYLLSVSSRPGTVPGVENTLVYEIENVAPP